MFRGRTLLIVTQHAKELVIAPVLEKNLGVICQVTKNLDTDQFGTFSGEVERSQSPIETLRMKCKAALHQHHADLVVASEGSFGPHPSLYFVPADDELVMLMDIQNNLEIVARELSIDTNFGQQTITTWIELEQFAQDHEFPNHALILKDATQKLTQIKGITTWEALKRSYDHLINTSAAVHVETDMRACYNPTRMKVIETAALKLVEKIHSVCPTCAMPGFDVMRQLFGLPCAWCGTPTRTIRAEVHHCRHCGYESEKEYPHGKMKADPSCCDQCNP